MTLRYLKQLLLLQGVDHLCSSTDALADSCQQVILVINEPDVLMGLPTITVLGQGQGDSHCDDGQA